ncbi:GNAT family N-acetyltransferase [Aquisalimonas asiatica]|uniref:Acetyltransferase (GNAT) family protein n=1 Tax=Aquisalimonas asiatica TaxID=406100 RepID=A0A1H8RH42_9GAMM|nr:GNAT family N-acetyltransferase [Aquisalimonas asiatica]SEO65715.1 Acetyltransferase (GNAT) family protein [Aquisalimonas asiatica]
MKLTFQQARNKDFVEQLTWRNMEPYYKELGISWDQAVFDKNWNDFENYEIVINDSVVGVLRLSHDKSAYYIRDLQVDPDWQHQGLGSQALRYTANLAQKSGFKLLRLRVFSENPAVGLYKRMGFRISKTESGTHYMERELS